MKRRLQPQNPLEHADVYLNRAIRLLTEYSGKQRIPESVKNQYVTALELAESHGVDIQGLPEKLGLEFVAEYRDPAFETDESPHKELFHPRIKETWEDYADRFANELR